MRDFRTLLIYRRINIAFLVNTYYNNTSYTINTHRLLWSSMSITHNKDFRGLVRPTPTYNPCPDQFHTVWGGCLATHLHIKTPIDHNNDKEGINAGLA